MQFSSGMFGKSMGAGSSYRALAYLGRKESEPGDMADKSNGGSLDEGVVSFGVWLNAQARDAPDIPMVLKKFVKDKLVILHDRVVGKTVTVNIIEGIPSCEECGSPDCSHVGFAICVEQMSKRSMIE